MKENLEGWMKCETWLTLLFQPSQGLSSPRQSFLAPGRRRDNKLMMLPSFVGNLPHRDGRACPQLPFQRPICPCKCPSHTLRSEHLQWNLCASWLSHLTYKGFVNDHCLWPGRQFPITDTRKPVPKLLPTTRTVHQVLEGNGLSFKSQVLGSGTL